MMKKKASASSKEKAESKEKKAEAFSSGKKNSYPEKTGKTSGQKKIKGKPGLKKTRKKKTGHKKSEKISTDNSGTENEVSPRDLKYNDNPLVSPEGNIRWRYLIWAFGSLIALGGFIWLLTAVQTVSVPFLTAFIIAYLLDPLVDRFEERGISRTIGISVLFILGLVIGTLFVLLVGPQLLTEFSTIPEKLRLLSMQISPWIEERFAITLPKTVEDAFTFVQQWLMGLEMKEISAPTLDFLRIFMGGTSGAISVIMGILLIPVFTFFLLRDFDNIVAGINNLIPVRYRQVVGDRFREIDAAMGGFVRGQLSVAGILAVMYSIGLWTVGLPLALFVGVISGIGNMVPYLGTAMGLVLATIVALLDWQGFGTLLLVYLVFAVVQGIESWVLTPRIVGDSVGLSPFLVIVAVILFGELFGFVGILIAVPLAAIVKILLRVLLEKYRESPFFRT